MAAEQKNEAGRAGPAGPAAAERNPEESDLNLGAELNRRASLFRRLVLPGGNLLDNETQPKRNQKGRQYREDEVLGSARGCKGLRILQQEESARQEEGKTSHHLVHSVARVLTFCACVKAGVLRGEKRFKSTESIRVSQLCLAISVAVSAAYSCHYWQISAAAKGNSTSCAGKLLISLVSVHASSPKFSLRHNHHPPPRSGQLLCR